MERNESNVDRILRGAVALILLPAAMGTSGALSVLLALVVILMGVTAAIGFCPLYRLLGYRSHDPGRA